MDKIKVIIDNKQKKVKIPTGLRMLVRRCCNAVLRLEEFSGSAEVSVTFVDNEQIRQLNKQYRDKDVPTDVLSFPMGENGVYDVDPATGAQILGDVVLSVEKAVEQASVTGTASSARWAIWWPIPCCICCATTMSRAALSAYICAKRRSSS